MLDTIEELLEAYASLNQNAVHDPGNREVWDACERKKQAIIAAFKADPARREATERVELRNMIDEAAGRLRVASKLLEDR